MITVPRPETDQGVVRINNGPDLIKATIDITVELDWYGLGTAPNCRLEWRLHVHTRLWPVGSEMRVAYLTHGNQMLIGGTALLTQASRDVRDLGCGVAHLGRWTSTLVGLGAPEWIDLRPRVRAAAS